MSYLTQDALEWALETLKKWGEQGNRNQKTLLRLFVLKAYDIPVGGVGSRALTTTDFTDACRRFFQVSYSGDGTAALTGGVTRYLDPFAPNYKLGPGSKSDAAVGTIWTRETWQKHNIVRRVIIDDATRFSFPDDYAIRLAAYLKRKIPLLPTAIFLLRKPSDAAVDPAEITDIPSLLQAFSSTFNFSEYEIETLFDSTDQPPEPVFQQHELQRQEIVDLALRVFPLDLAVDEARASSEAERLVTMPTALEPEDVADKIGLVGVDNITAQVEAALDAGMHVILIGPPGTGKTTIAKAVSAAAMGGEGYSVHTATSEWTTFDTIGGYMPDGGGGLKFAPGIIVDAILNGPRWLIIDELNRADIDKAFGEMFTLLAGGEVRLAYGDKPGDTRYLLRPQRKVDDISSGHIIVVPSSWRMIGTMNTFDKASLHQLSYAFMRRFAFIEVGVPTTDEMEAIIAGTIAKFKSEGVSGETVELLDELQGIYVSVFARETGIYTDELKVGPALPLSMLRYTKSRCRGFKESSDTKASDLFVEAATSLLFPQFEGRRGLRNSLLQGLTSWVKQGEREHVEEKIRRNLKGWLGDAS